MELIFFSIFLGLILFFTVLGFWRKEFLAMYVAGFMMIILGIGLLVSGITYTQGELQETNSTAVYSYYNISGYYTTEDHPQNYTVIQNITTTESVSIIPIEINKEDGIVLYLAIILILVAIYIIYLAILLTPNGDEE